MPAGRAQADWLSAPLALAGSWAKRHHSSHPGDQVVRNPGRAIARPYEQRARASYLPGAARGYAPGMSNYRIVQYNLAWLVAPLDDPAIAEFRENIERINRLAERAPGFVWRYQTRAGDSTSVRVRDDPRILVNMSMWRCVEDLHHFAFRTEHADFFRRRRLWFSNEDKPYAVLWWVAKDHRPEVAEAEARLAQLKELGPSPRAFTFKCRFPAPDANEAPAACPDPEAPFD